jgi:hypothetical protein
VVYAIGLAPNILGSLFNILYNDVAIIGPWDVPKPVFNTIIGIVNGVFFPLGMIIIAVAIRPVSVGLRQLGTGACLSPNDLAVRRQRALSLGRMTAAVCVGCWLVAGVIWPFALRLAAGPPVDGPFVYLHLLISLVICGVIAATYPYFLVTFLAVRVFYPSLLGPDGPAPSDGPTLRRVERELFWYWAVTNAVPFLGLALILIRASFAPEKMSDQALPLVATLSVIGLAGVAVAYLLQGRIRADLVALADVPTGNTR